MIKSCGMFGIPFNMDKKTNLDPVSEFLWSFVVISITDHFDDVTTDIRTGLLPNKVHFFYC